MVDEDDKPDSMAALLERITPEVYTGLKKAVELGKWENGQPLTRAQVEHCLQAVIAYEHHNVPVHRRTGYIKPAGKPNSACDARGNAIVSDRHPTSGSSTNES